MNVFFKDEVELTYALKDVSSLIDTSIEQSHTFVKPLLQSQQNNKGKFLRPALVLIAGQLGDDSRFNEVKKTASVIEMIHMASLIHDDIIDDAKTRRGLPTLNALVGPKQAVLAGDYLLSKAMSLIADREGDLDAKVVSIAFSRLCESELEQDANVGNFSISINSYLKRIGGKTASLFALSGYAGAAVALADKKHQQKMHEIGYLMGMTFQIQDDILDYNGNSNKMGKEIGKDLICKIPTLPLLEALKEEQKLPAKEQQLFNLVSKKRLSKRNILKAQALVVKLNGIKKAKELANSYSNRAKEAIKQLNNSNVEEILLSLFAKLSQRNS
jgi:heptaprenyl diphosphate synthase